MTRGWRVSQAAEGNDREMTRRKEGEDARGVLPLLPSAPIPRREDRTLSAPSYDAAAVRARARARLVAMYTSAAAASTAPTTAHSCQVTDTSM